MVLLKSDSNQSMSDCALGRAPAPDSHILQISKAVSAHEFECCMTYVLIAKVILHVLSKSSAIRYTEARSIWLTPPIILKRQHANPLEASADAFCRSLVKSRQSSARNSSGHW